MNKFSAISKERLATCDERIQTVFQQVIKYFDCSIIEGHRGEALQRKYFNQGKSKVNWPDSMHNHKPSKAVDLAPYPIVFDDIKRFYYFAGWAMGIAISLNIKLRWGGDWSRDTQVKDNKFNDLVHYELID